MNPGPGCVALAVLYGALCAVLLNIANGNHPVPKASAAAHRAAFLHHSPGWVEPLTESVSLIACIVITGALCWYVLTSPEDAPPEMRAAAVIASSVAAIAAFALAGTLIHRVSTPALREAAEAVRAVAAAPYAVFLFDLWRRARFRIYVLVVACFYVLIAIATIAVNG